MPVKLQKNISSAGFYRITKGYVAIIKYLRLMYSKQDASKLRHEFWTTFGKYMSPVPSAEGEKVNWINYKTGEQHIAFKMYADASHAVISITLSHPDMAMRHLYFEQLLQLLPMLHTLSGNIWQHAARITDENGLPVSRVFIEKAGVNIFNREDWPSLISFFKPHMIALDEFWGQARYAFEALRS